jgi:hypothetical protein
VARRALALGGVPAELHDEPVRRKDNGDRIAPTRIWFSGAFGDSVTNVEIRRGGGSVEEFVADMLSGRASREHEYSMRRLAFSVDELKGRELFDATFRISARSLARMAGKDDALRVGRVVRIVEPIGEYVVDGHLVLIKAESRDGFELTVTCGGVGEFRKRNTEAR